MGEKIYDSLGKGDKIKQVFKHIYEKRERERERLGR